MKTNHECFTAYAFPGRILLLCNRHPVTPKAEDMFTKYGRKKQRLWRRRTQNRNCNNPESGILGSYEAAGIVDRDLDGTSIPLFEDTELKDQSGNLCLERHMIVGGKKFVINSGVP